MLEATMLTWIFGLQFKDRLLLIRQEPTNSKDNNAVVFLEDVIVGHVPYNLAPQFSQFLRRDVSKDFAEVTGAKVN